MSTGFRIGCLLFATLLAACPALAYDYGCHDQWKGPSADNDVFGCVTGISNNNPGVLVPPVIPIVFLALVVVAYPLTFFCRLCGACGSNTVRPGADCCCDGEEWDEIEDDEKVAYYPPKHVRCVKCVCLAVVLLSIIPIILMPIGASYAKNFWDGFFTSMNRDVLDWVAKIKTDFQNDLQTSPGNYVPPLTASTFDGFESFITTGRKNLADLNTMAVTNFDLVSNFIIGIAAVPLVLLATMLLFIMCNVRKIAPAGCTCVYFFFLVIFSLFSCFMMLLGVVFVLTCGEITLQSWKAPGIFQWYVVPLCEKKVFFTELKKNFNDANVQQGREICLKLTDMCDDNPGYVPIVNTLFNGTTKPFYCTINNANVNQTCPSVPQAAVIINQTQVKSAAAPFVCNGTSSGNCTIGTCPEDCTYADARNLTREARDKLSIGLRVINAMDRAFVHADCDVLITRVLMPFKECRLLSVGTFLAASGAGLGALFLMFGIVLMFKGQKLFFGRNNSYVTPKSDD